MPSVMTDEKTEAVVEVAELTESQLVFEHGTQAVPVVCVSAGDRAN